MLINISTSHVASQPNVLDILFDVFAKINLIIILEFD